MIRKKNNIYLFLLCCFFLIASCEKDLTCEALIIVKDNAGNKIDGANIKLWVPPSNLSDPTATTINWAEELTNISGEAYFSVKNEAVMEIVATKGSLFGTGFVVLQSGIMVQQEVFIN